MQVEVDYICRNLCWPLTSHKNNSYHQLEDAVDEWEGKHELQIFKAEGQLDDGAAQLRVLEARLQGDGSASEQSEDGNNLNVPLQPGIFLAT